MRTVPTTILECQRGDVHRGDRAPSNGQPRSSPMIELSRGGATEA